MPNSILDELGFDDNNDANTQGDPAVWTLLGEAGKDPKGQLAVASTIANRAKLLKATDYNQVVTDPSQGYEAWQDETARVNAQKNYPINSPEYKRAAALLDDLKSGKIEPLSYDSFYSPSAQSQKRRQPPVFEDNKTGVDIGGNRFFVTKNPSSSVLDDLGFGETPGHDPGVTDSVSNIPLPDPQAKAARELQKSGDLVIDPKTKEALYKGMPLYQSHGNEEPQKPGDYWLDKSGNLHQVPVDYNGAINYGNSALLGFGNKLMAGVQALKATGGNPTDSMFGNFYNQALSHYQEGQQVYSKEHPIASAAQQFGGNATTVLPTMALGGELLAPARAAMGPVGDFLSGASQGGKFSTAASRATSGALQGGIASGMTAGESDKPFLQQVGEGALVGGVANPVLGGAYDFGKSLVTGGSTKGVTPAVANLAKIAVDKYKLPIRLTQIKGVRDRAQLVADSELIGRDAAHAANNAEQHSAFTKAVAQTFGSDEDRLTPDVMEDARTRIGETMNEIARRTDITKIDPLLTRLGTIAHEAGQVVPDTELKPILKQIQSIADTIQNGKLSGESYKALVRKGSPLYRAANGSLGNIRSYTQDIKNALDDAAEAEMAPGDKEAWDKARLQYKNLMTVSNLAAKANVEGEIQPGLLTGAVNTNFKNSAFQGAGDLGELAKIGKTFLREPGNSFTTDRFVDRLKRYAPSVLGGAGLADLGLALRDPILAGKLAGTAAIGAAIKGGVNLAKNKSNLSPSVRNKFLNNVLMGTSAKDEIYNPLIPLSAISTKNLFQQQGNQ